jgi:Big-like domain-containing protein
MSHTSAGGARLSIAVLISSLLTACGGAGGSSGGGGDWYYHFSCNGDSQCLITNPIGRPSGNLNEGPVEANCTQLMQFAAGPGGWGPAAFDACDQSPAFPLHLLSLTVSPSGSSLALGATRQFQAIAHYNDGSYRDVTAQAVWSISSGNTHASIGSGGLVTAVAQGTATVQATMGVVSGSATVTVGPVAIVTITVAPTDPAVAKGQQQAFTATGHYSDGSAKDVTATAYWSSTPGAVATVTQGGLASGVQAGTATITASLGGASGSTTLTVAGAVLVTIVVEPATPSVARTFSRALQAIGTFSDGSAADVTGLASWTSATPAVATIDSTGLVTGVAAGSSLVTATVGAISGHTTLTVTPATLVSITVAPTTPIVAPGSKVPFIATGHFSDGATQLLTAGVTWSSGTTSVATVDSTGLASGVAVGTSTVTANLGAVSGSSLLTIATAPPGMNWAYLATSPPVTCTACPTVTSAFSSIVWSGTEFVAVALSGAIVTSPDGLTWTTRMAGSSYGVVASYGPLMSVTWAASLGRFVAVGPGNIVTSPDGITWAGNTTGAIFNDYLYGVVWSGTQFVAVGWVYGTSTPAILTSPDGLTWTARSTAASGTLRSVAWSGTLFVAVGDATLVSTDGISWASVVDATTGWTGITWTGSQFVEVGVGAGSTGKIRTSADGFTWTDRTVTSPPFYGVAWTGTELVAVGGTGGLTAYGLGGVQGSPGCMSTSTDGVTWTPSSVSAVGTLYDTTYTLYGVAFNGTRLVAVGSGINSYFVYTSP